MTIETGEATQTPSQAMDKLKAWSVEVIARAQNLTPVLERISQAIQEMIDQAAAQRKTPKGMEFWPLSPATQEIYGNTKAPTGNLAKSFTINLTPTNILLNSALPYANAQIYGNPENRLFGTNVIAPIPARPLLDIEGENMDFPDAQKAIWEGWIVNYIFTGELEPTQ